MKPWLFVGAKVVCVDASLRTFHIWGGDAPVEGAVYTVTGVHAGRGIDKGLIIVDLAEIKAGCMRGGIPEDGYRSDRFRPLHDTTQTVQQMRDLMIRARDTRKVTA